MAALIDGRALAARSAEATALRVQQLRFGGLEPTLAVLLVGTDPASEVYVGRKTAQCARVGIRSIEHRLPADADEAMLAGLIDGLNRDPGVHGILVQLPLPPHFDAGRILDRILPEKDVDGFHPVNVGRLSTGGGGLVPCTPLGVLRLLDSVVTDLKGLHAVVIGKSNVVGKPVAVLLLEREATVTVTHIATRDLATIVRTADIVVAAAGSPRLVRGDWIKPGAVVVDVGITRVEDATGKRRLVGDCAADEMDHAAAVTPVPGGVGPMTVACLLENTVRAAESSRERRC